MLSLIANVGFHPFQIVRPKAHDTVAALPLQQFLTVPDPLVHIVRRSSFHLPDKVAHEDRGHNRDGNMNMSLRTTDFMDLGARCLDKSRA